MADIYHIRIQSHLDESWSACLCDMAMTHEAGGTTLLTGPVADQAALLGLLRKLHDLGVTVLSVTCSLNNDTEQDMSMTAQLPLPPSIKSFDDLQSTFDYDQKLPLNFKETRVEQRNGVSIRAVGEVQV